MKLAIEIIKKVIAQREHANTHNHLNKDETNAEIESLGKVVNFISSNPDVIRSKFLEVEKIFLSVDAGLFVKCADGKTYEIKFGGFDIGGYCDLLKHEVVIEEGQLDETEML